MKPLLSTPFNTQYLVLGKVTRIHVSYLEQLERDLEPLHSADDAELNHDSGELLGNNVR